MDSNIRKHKKLERYLNIVEFKRIKIGSLLAQTFEFNYYNPCRKSFKNFIRIFKYLIYVFFPKNSIPIESDFIFTKLIRRFHFDELMNPLIIHYLKESAIVCNENSFDQVIMNRYIKNQHVIKFSQTINNDKKDIIRILSVFVRSSWILIRNKKRLNLSKDELFFFLAQLIIQLRSVSFWDSYFLRSVKKPKCIVTEFDRNSVSSALILCARNYNITTITLTHGVICDYGFTPLLADYIFCWGKFQQNQLIEQGVPRKKILITGNPMVKGFEHKNRLNSGLIVCLAISPEILNQSMIEMFVSAINGFDQLSGIIKLHPSQYKHNYLWIHDLSSKVTVKDSEEITNNALFEKIDLLLIHQSGIANEALASGIPVAIMEPNGSGNFSELQRELINSAGCRAVNNTEQLKALFSEFILDPESFKIRGRLKSRQYLENLFEVIGEDSIKAMIDNINRLTA
jgi:hypothetical protein